MPRRGVHGEQTAPVPRLGQRSPRSRAEQSRRLRYTLSVQDSVPSARRRRALPCMRMYVYSGWHAFLKED